MITQLKLGDIVADVTLKDIKNVHLSVYPPYGKVRISAPLHMNLDTIRVFTISKRGWIKQQQKKLREQARETQREYLNRESHYVWGKRYLLVVSEIDQAPSVELKHSQIVFRVRPGTDNLKMQVMVEGYYRRQIKAAAWPIIAKWEPQIGVKVEKLFVRKMKTRWGSCNQIKNSIRLNTDLAKKPLESLEYIIVHEMVHLLEPTHNKNFVALMDKYMPKWQFYRAQLNRLPVSHEEWGY